MTDHHARARGQFLEMQGLRLTLDQAARLFCLDRTECARTLDTLVDAGFLQRSGGHYLRTDDGPLRVPSSRRPLQHTASTGG